MLYTGTFFPNSKPYSHFFLAIHVAWPIRVTMRTWLSENFCNSDNTESVIFNSGLSVGLTTLPKPCRWMQRKRSKEAKWGTNERDKGSFISALRFPNSSSGYICLMLWLHVKQIAQLWQTDCASPAILWRRVILRQNFRLNGYCSR